MSIVRIGLGETKNFATGYDAIFAKKKPAAGKKAKPASSASGKKSGKAKKK